MLDFVFQQLLSLNGFMPHGHCYLWNRGLHLAECRFGRADCLGVHVDSIHPRLLRSQKKGHTVQLDVSLFWNVHHRVRRYVRLGDLDAGPPHTGCWVSSRRSRRWRLCRQRCCSCGLCSEGSCRFHTGYFRRRRIGFARLLESAPRLVVVDEAGKMVVVNAQTEKLYGVKGRLGGTSAGNG